MTTPVAWLLTTALWLGCLVPSHRLAVAGAAGAAVVAAVLRSRPGRVAVAALAMAALGSGLAGAWVAASQRGPLVTLAAQGGAADLAALVVSDARPTPAGAWLLVRVTSVDGRRSGQRALLRVDEPAAAPALGARIALTATARPLEAEGFDAYLRRLHVVAAVTPVSRVHVVRPPPALLRTTTTVRERLRGAAARHLPPAQAALLTGLVTGDTQGWPPAEEQTLRDAGLSHLVAVSGSNVALVIAGAVGVAALLRLGARGRRRVALAAVLWFVVLVRGEPSVLRASAMALLVLAARTTGRGHDGRHTLAVAVAVLLVIDPLLSGHVGFVLSVLACAGVLIVGPAVAARVPGPATLRSLVGATVGAQVGVAPVLVTLEGGAPLGALPANLVAVPAAAVATAVGVVAALVAQVVPAAGGWVALLAQPALALVLWAGRTFAGAPALHVGHLLPVVAAGVALLVARRIAPRAASVVAAAAVVVAVAAPWARPAAVVSLSLTALDVGQGDALLVEVPPAAAGLAPARMLVDGGPEPGLAVRLLRRRGIAFLDAVVVSHPHADHTNGLPAVLSAIPVGALLVGPTPLGRLDGPAPSAAATEAVAAQRGVPVTRVSAGQRFSLGSATVEVLSPPADGSLGRQPNDNSLVLRVVTPQGRILLAGDAEAAAQSRLLARPDLLRAELLKVPHHGGATNAPGFFTAVAARAAVIGVGDDNDYGHPHPDVLQALAGLAVLRTDVHGTVTATVDAAGLYPAEGSSAASR